MKGDFRLAGTLKEFYGELDALKKSTSKILVWQTDEKGKRSTYDCQLQSYVANKDVTTISIKANDAKTFNKDLPVFIYEEKKGILFKGSYETFVNNVLRILAEDKVFLKEKRMTSRLNFHYTKVYVDLVYGDKIDFNHMKLKDINEYGFGLLCTESMAKALVVGVELNIKTINKIEMPVPLQGVIVHKTPSHKVRGAKKGFILVGVKFNQKSKLITKVIEALN